MAARRRLRHRRVERRNQLHGSGALNDPERLDQLDQLRRSFDSATRATPARPFREVLAERERGRGAPAQQAQPKAQQEGSKGARDPLLGLSPTLKVPAGGRRRGGGRSSKVIVKG